jgi:hypothetical protein
VDCRCHTFGGQIQQVRQSDGPMALAVGGVNQAIDLTASVGATAQIHLCQVTHALLPSFLHLFRRYTLTLIQQAVTLALDAGLWGDALADAVGPYSQPAALTLREWLWSFAHGAERLTNWLQYTLTTIDPLAELDPGRPPARLRAIHHLPRRVALTRAWQFVRLGEALYSAARARQPDLAFQADCLFAFLTAALLTAGRPPRLLWRQAQPRAPT